MTGRAAGGGGGTPDSAAGRLAENPISAGLFCDFDGTLTPIIDDPTTSRLDDGFRELLARLAQRLGAVAVVSGRPAAFLVERVAVPDVLLLGLYGLETAVGGTVTARPEVSAWEPAVERAKSSLADGLGGQQGVWVEDKGRSVAVHWRNAPDQAAAERLISATVQTVAEATGLAVEPGKLVAELRPPVAWDKGAAVDAVCDERGLLLPAYLGDDRGDLPAFAAVSRRGGLALAVDHGGETPPELAAASDVVLPGVEGTRDWLRGLAGRL